MPKNKKDMGDEDLKPIEIPEEDDDKILPIPEEDDLSGDELDDDEEEPEDNTDMF